MLRHELILNPRLLALLAGAGHGDIIVVADSGLPIPNTVEVVDLSLIRGVPSFLQVLE
ncbi:MAG: RbsD/FucU domain-containing protein [Chloroflexota bacterium]